MLLKTVKYVYNTVNVIMLPVPVGIKYILKAVHVINDFDFISTCLIGLYFVFTRPEPCYRTKQYNKWFK